MKMSIKKGFLIFEVVVALCFLATSIYLASSLQAHVIRIKTQAKTLFDAATIARNAFEQERCMLHHKHEDASWHEGIFHVTKTKTILATSPAGSCVQVRITVAWDDKKVAYNSAFFSTNQEHVREHSNE